MPAKDILDSDSKKTLAFKITEDVKRALEEIGNKYSADKDHLPDEKE